MQRQHLARYSKNEALTQFTKLNSKSSQFDFLSNYFAKNWDKFLKALNSRAFPAGAVPTSKIPNEIGQIPFVDGSGVGVRIQYRAIWNSSVSTNLKVFIPHLRDAAERLSKGLAQP